jgi:hypothetical protein
MMYSILNPQHCGHLNFKPRQRADIKRIEMNAKILKTICT